jgi:hypothetical protein
MHEGQGFVGLTQLISSLLIFRKSDKARGIFAFSDKDQVSIGIVATYEKGEPCPPMPRPLL